MNEGHYLKRAIEYFNQSWHIFAGFLAISLFGAGLNSTSNPNYIATAHIIVKQSESSPLQAISATVSGLHMGNNESEMNRYITFFTSMELYRKLADLLYKHENYRWLREDVIRGRSSFFAHQALLDFNNLPFFNKKAHFDMPSNEQIDDLSNQLREIVTFRSLDPTTIQLRTRTGSAESSSFIVNTLIDLAISEISKHDVEELEFAKKFLEKQLAEVSTRIKKIESVLVREKRSAGIANFEAFETDVSEDRLNVRQDLIANSLRIENNKRQIERLKNEMKLQIANGTNITATFADKSKFSFASKIQRLESENRELQSRIDTIRPLANKYAEVQRNMPKTEQTIFSLRKQMDLEYAYYSELKNQILKMNMQNMSLQNRISRLDKPEDVRVTQFMSPTIQAGMGVMIGLIFAVMVCFLFETMSPHIFNRKDIEDLDIRYLGAVSEFAPSLLDKFVQMILHPGGKNSKSEPVPLVSDLNNTESICFRYLRSTIVHLLRKTSTRSPIIALVSPISGEGKTFITFNLSHMFARAKKRTLIIDCDFHIGSLTKACKSSDKLGITDYLTGKIEHVGSLVTRLDEHLDIVAVGQSCQAAIEHIPEHSFDQFLEKFRDKYDYIVLDTPAVIPAVDALDMIKHVDLIVIALLYGRSRIDLARRTVEKIRHVTHAPLSYILNKHNFDEDSSYSYYYYDRPVVKKIS